MRIAGEGDWPVAERLIVSEKQARRGYKCFSPRYCRPGILVRRSTMPAFAGGEGDLAPLPADQRRTIEPSQSLKTVVRIYTGHVSRARQKCAA